jgi:hypothetical protein
MENIAEQLKSHNAGRILIRAGLEAARREGLSPMTM